MLAGQPRSADIPVHVTALMEIDLDCVRHNYHFLQKQLSPGCTGAAVLKANGYGTGAIPVARALLQAGCQTFYVATLDEALALRQEIPEVTQRIFMLNGLLPGMEELCIAHHITPVLNAPEQVALWAKAARASSQELSAAVHFDTGLNRVGIAHHQAVATAQTLANAPQIQLQAVLSHLACSDQAGHERNALQLDRFRQVLKFFPRAMGSFANSHGVFLGTAYHFQQVRAGRGLYGVGSRSLTAQGFRQAVRVYAKILQLRDVPAGEYVGYGAGQVMARPSRLAILGIGYADGLLRTHTYAGVLQIQGHAAPIVGRISMDLIAVDVTDIPEGFVHPGIWANYIGDHASVSDAARAAGTIAHEVLVNMSTRYFKKYLNATGPNVLRPAQDEPDEGA